MSEEPAEPAEARPAGVGQRVAPVSGPSHTVTAPASLTFAVPLRTSEGLFELSVANQGVSKVDVRWNGLPVFRKGAIRKNAVVTAPVIVVANNALGISSKGKKGSLTVSLAGHLVDEAAPELAFLSPTAGQVLGQGDAIVVAFSAKCRPRWTGWRPSVTPTDGGPGCGAVSNAHAS